LRGLGSDTPSFIFGGEQLNGRDYMFFFKTMKPVIDARVMSTALSTFNAVKMVYTIGTVLKTFTWV
jgi:hypothetical protein